MVEIAEINERPDAEEWRSYDEFSAGIDTYRLPAVSLEGRETTFVVDDGSTISLSFQAENVTWSAAGTWGEYEQREDPYDAVRIREDVWFLNLPLTSTEGEAITFTWSERTGCAIVVRSTIAPEKAEGEPQVRQSFNAARVDGLEQTGPTPAESRDLIGMRNIYRYSPNHLYEHVYMSTERYAWQNLQGAQRGHGDMDMSTVWKLDDGLYIFCFREFRISVASVWLHDLGYNLMTTGIFLGINENGRSEHKRAGGHVYPLGSVRYPDVQPV